MRVLIQELDVITSLAVAPMQLRKCSQHKEQACVLSYNVSKERRHTNDPSQRLQCQTERGILTHISESPLDSQFHKVRKKDYRNLSSIYAIK